jgi:hypothetical protein
VVVLRDLVSRSVSLNYGTPADRVDIKSSIAIREKGSVSQDGSIIAVHQKKQHAGIKLVVRHAEHSRNLLQKTFLPPKSMAAIVSPKEISTIGWRFSEVEEQTSPFWHETNSVYRREV